MPRKPPAKGRTIMQSRRFSRAEISTHNDKSDIMIIIDNLVYDITHLIDNHPGGNHVLMEYAGKDASEAFKAVNHTLDAIDWREKFLLGQLTEEDKWDINAPHQPAEKEKLPVAHGGPLTDLGLLALAGILFAVFYYYVFCVECYILK